MPHTRSSRRLIAARKSEEGYVMLTAIFFMALLALSLTIAAPRVARSIQREREVETFHRGMQYRRAIQLYYRQFHAYPPTVDALNKTNNMRFLRKAYIDPMTRKSDWKPVMYGQNKTPTAMGFFGQPLAGNASTIAGVGPSGGNNNSRLGSIGSAPSGSSSAMGSIFSSSGSDIGTLPPRLPERAQDPERTAPPARPEPQGLTWAQGVARTQQRTARPSAARESSAFRRAALRNPYWSTKRKITLTSGSSHTTPFPMRLPSPAVTQAPSANPPAAHPIPWALTR